MADLQGKVALVTGAGRGQGRSHAIRLARAGAHVVVADIDYQIEPIPYEMNSPGDMDMTVDLVKKHGVDAFAVSCDVRASDQMNAAVQSTLERFDRLDILVANAGGWCPAPITEMTDEAWNTILSINLTGAFNSIRAAAPPMIKRNWGRIILTSSTLGRQGMPNMANYVATRWAQLGLIKVAAFELGPHNITVNAICPSMVETDQVTNDTLYRLFRPDLSNPNRADAEVVMKQMHKLPTAWIQPDDVSAVVEFLASDEARFITAVGIDVSAGKATEYGA
jgi:SDR family mycofactocin-dependent oxidoreductase